MSGIIAQNASNATGLIKAAAAGGAWTLLTTSTASSSSTISFTSNINSTYPIYLFTFNSLHPSGNAADGNLTFNGSIDAGSNYNVTKQTTFFQAGHAEDDSETSLGYDASEDIAQGTGFQNLSSGVKNDNDACLSGELWLFNPSSTTFVKHFIAVTQYMHSDPASRNSFISGYFNDTNDIDAIQFKPGSGTFDAGTIKLYGLGDS